MQSCTMLLLLAKAKGKSVIPVPSIAQSRGAASLSAAHCLHSFYAPVCIHSENMSTWQLKGPARRWDDQHSNDVVEVITASAAGISRGAMQTCREAEQVIGRSCSAWQQPGSRALVKQECPSHLGELRLQLIFLGSQVPHLLLLLSAHGPVKKVGTQ